MRSADALSLYHPRWQQQAPWIELFVDNIAKRWPEGKPTSYLSVNLAFAQVFYHELGHHIHAEHHPEYRPKENVADEWSERMTKRFMWRGYWHFLIFVAPAYAAWKWLKALGARITRRVHEKV